MRIQGKSFFLFLFFISGRFNPKWSETAPIWFDSIRIRRGRRKICYQKICEKKKGEGEEERSATKWFMRKEEKKKKKKMMMMMWRCGGWSSTASYYHRNSLLWNFKKGKDWWQMIVDFQIKPWNVILIKQFIMAKYFDNCINWNNYLSLKNNIILQNLLPKY